MRSRAVWQVLKLALLAVALIATAAALWVHLFERRALEDQDRHLAATLERALEESRANLKAEILEEIEAGIPAQENGQPRPGAVLRRSESARDRALQQALSPESEAAAAIAGLEQRLDTLARQADRTGRDLQEIQAELRRERNAAGKILGLLITALAALGLHVALVLVEERVGRKARVRSGAS